MPDDMKFDIKGQTDVDVLTPHQHEYLFKEADDAVFVIDKSSGKIISVNQKASILLGIPTEKIIGLQSTDLYPEEERERCQTLFKEHLDNGIEFETRTYLFNSQGQRIPVEIRAGMVDMGDRQVSLGIFKDLTERYRMEKILREKENLIRTYLDVASIIILVLDERGDVELINQLGARILGYPVEEIIGKNWFDHFLPGKIRKEVKKVFKDILAGDLAPHQNHEHSILTRDGSERLISWKNAHVRDDQGRIITIVSSGEDITEDHLLDQKVIAEKEFSRFIINGLPGIFYMFDEKSTMYQWNLNLETLSGFTPEEISRMNPLDFIAEYDRDRVTEAIKEVFTTGSTRVEAHFLTKDGAHIPFYFTGQRLKRGDHTYMVGTGYDVSERRKAQDALLERDRMYRDLINNMDEVMMVLDDGGCLTHISDAITKISGYLPEEVTGKHFSEFVYKEDLERIAGQFNQLVQGITEVDEYRIVTKSGDIRWVLSSSQPLFSGGQFQGARGILTDIHDFKMAKMTVMESEEKFHTLSEQSPNMIFINHRGRVVYANERCSEILGYAREELVDPTFDFRELIAPEYLETIENNFKAHMEGAEALPVEYDLIKKDRSRLSVILTTRLIPYGEDTAIMGIVTDITDRKKIERALKESEKRFRTIVEIAPCLFMIVDAEGNNLYVSPNCEEMTGYTQEELLGTMIWWVHESDSERAMRSFKRALKEETSGSHLEFRAVKKNGDSWYASSSWEPVYDEDESFIGLIVQTLDVTDRKLVENALQESEAILRTAIESLPFDFFAIGENGCYVMQNTVCAEHWGNVIGKTPAEICKDKEILARWEDNNTRAFQGETVRGEIALSPEGSEGYYYNIISPIRDDEKISGIIGVNIDISERKKAETALEKSEKQYRELIENMNDVVYKTDAQGLVTYISPVVEKLIGYKPEEIIGRSITDFVSGEDLSRMQAGFKSIIHGSAHSGEYRIYTKSGETRWIKTSSRPSYSGDKLVGAQGIVSDITLRKKADDNIRKLSSAVEQSANIVLITDASGTIEYVNPKFSEVTGYALEEVIGNTPRILKSGSQDDEVYTDLWNTITNGQVWAGECHNRRKDGSYYWAHQTISPVKDDYGNITHFIGIQEDISERIRSQEELTRSEERLRSIYENAIVGLYRTTPDGTVLMANPALLRMMGYESVSDLARKNVARDGYMNSKDRETFLALMTESGKVEGLETTWVRKDGSPLHVRENATAVYDNDGSLLFFEGTVEDLSEKRVAEKALYESEERYRSVIEQASDPIYILDSDANILDVNSAGSQKLGYSKDELSSMNFRDLILPADLKTVPLQLDRLKKGETVLIERSLVRKDGSLLPLEISAKMLQGNIIQGIARDITERKKAEEALRKRDRRLRHQNLTLLNLASSKSFIEGDEVEVFREITEQSARTLEVERISIWLFDPGVNRLICLDHYQQSNHRHSSGDELSRQDIPNYLNAIEKERALAVHDTHTDPRTDEFLDNYFLPLGINSVLDARIIVSGKTAGVIWFEHVGPKRVWEFDEQQFAGSVADLAALALEGAQRKRSEEELRKSEERYALAAMGANDGLWDWDLTSDTVYYSPRWKTMLGYVGEDVGNKPDDWFSKVHEDDLDLLKTELNAHLDNVTPHFENEHRILHKDGSYRWVLTRGLAVRDPEDRVTRMAGSQTDITDRKTAEEQLLHDAFHDALTGLPNRALFSDRLGQAIERDKREEGYPFSVLLLDLDRFKVVNDSLGHMIGDKLLINVAQKLQVCLRPGDTVARFGGDEFAILVDGVGDINKVAKVADKVQSAISTPLTLNGHEVVTTASIGITTSFSGYDRSELYLRDADTAMYRAKSEGRACYVTFDDEMHARALSLLKMETDLRRAFDKQEFEVYYQPVINLTTGKIHGFEALVRWNHPERGLILPGDFIPIAEDSGFIYDLDKWILGQAIDQLVEWRRTFTDYPDLCMSANLSGKIISRYDFVGSILETLERKQFPEEYFYLEITESALIENIDIVKKAFAQLKSRGVKLCIDDFGTGYSSLSYLHYFPLDTLKIDQSFVNEMKISAGGSEIISTIIALGHNLGMSVLAEGVEEDAQLVALKHFGCDYVQGFLISAPLPAEEVGKMLVENREW